MAARICSAPLPIRVGLSETQRWAMALALHGAALVLGAGTPAAAQQATPAPSVQPASALPASAPQPAPDAVAPPPPAADTDLRDLIPDAAMQNPEAWAKAAHPAPVDTLPAAPQAETPPGAVVAAGQEVLRPDSPMSDIPGLTLPWPEGEQAITPIPPMEPEPDAAAALVEAVAGLPGQIQSGGAQLAGSASPAGRESVLAGGHLHLAWPTDAQLPERAVIEARFRPLSSLQTAGKNETEQLGQVVARGAADRKLMEQLMRIYGYYDAEVTQTVIGGAENGQGENGQPGAAGGLAAVRFDVQAGARYRIGAVTTGDLARARIEGEAMLRAASVAPGDPLNLDTITAARTRIATALGDAGYPFAKVPTPSLTVDHARFEGDIDMPVENGGYYVFGAITSNQPRFFSPHHLGEIARFRKGDMYRADMVEDLRRAVLATGLVGTVSITPRSVAAPQGDPPVQGKPGVSALDVVVSKAPLHTISGELGYDTGEGYRIAASWEHRNLFPPEGALKFRGILGTNEQLAGTTFRRSNFLGRDRVLTVDLYATNATLAAYAARKVGLAVSYERQTNILFQKPWTWSMGLEVMGSEEREGLPSGVTTGRTLYVTGALPLRAGIDSTDDLLDPRRGHRVSLRVSPEIVQSNGATSTYARIQLDASAYRPVSEGVVVAGRLRLGSMPGTAINDVAPSRRFYAGGGSSIRGYGYLLVGPRNSADEPKGGRSLYEFSLEARVNTPLLSHNLQIVPFIDAGGVETGTVPRMNDWRFGAGMGVRYKTSFGPIRIDIGTPLNPRKGDSPIGVYVALGQAF